ncbi:MULTISPECIES: LysR family transcriptional regulator [Xanthomonas]|uniref:LysR substrate-binding domain-containing protein n=1 Tax=Xanthomonas rydalmerensis TaxID=3046274 RepID=A0ABZ0JLU4_9XANT|nr:MULTISPECIES: LysR family transcriptional regulator [unclassified Xanthomonas]MBB5878775.1 DNA-binding transcriptional LysR family regulator [Xanthomonas sp. 3498]MBB5941771.1 DNA-binding transcriptional LysR family regulator [Xanthomonas sp. 3307]WOS40396.1 LysR substrate-binding domain-containing protein [Xanthomonas sp. DM-2023]WOS44580.1 LysR substrate-binding domain-containing protein [Xanthomonas sp. DM-2023]WOS48760.1 LysR substrate-binding domain-containing protein [Xanthomonas sp. 
MELRQLRYFVAVARERNFTRAAELLHIAQPPLSRQIQQLEEQLGTRLLVRSSRPLRLTDAGKLLYEEALQILGRVEQMQDATRRLGRSEQRVFSIGFVASSLYGGLPTLVRRLRQQRPDLDIRLLELMSGEQIEALKTGRIDLGIGRIRHDDDMVERFVLREERLAVALPMDHPLATSDAPLAPEALTAQRLIVYPSQPRPSFADQVLSLLRDRGIRPLAVQEVRELQTALGLVAADLGLCVIPTSVRVLRRDLHYRLLDDERATSPIILSHRRNDSSDLLPLIMQLIREMYLERPAWLDSAYNRLLLLP